jgi:hypothetical protein
MAIGSFYGGGVGQVLSQWQQAGVFDYIIPFLLIFAVVYGILIQMKLFGGKKTSTGRIVNAIIALSVGLMSLQFNFVGIFFAELFPRVGIGLVILLLVTIFTGLFADPKSKGMMYAMYAIGAIILVVVLAQSGSVVGWLDYAGFYGVNWMEWLPWIILIVLLGAVVGSGKERKDKAPESVFAKLLNEKPE